MATGGSPEPSVVEYFYQGKEPEGRRCGYCSCENGYVSNGLWAHRMTCMDYKNLIDRGWRRSGRYCYKPQNDKTCCPLYTISCDATNFVLSKSQKKTLIKFKRYLDTGSVKDSQKADNPSPKQDAIVQKEHAKIVHSKGIKKSTSSTGKSSMENSASDDVVPVRESPPDSKKKEASTRTAVPLGSTASTSSSSPQCDSLRDPSSTVADPCTQDKKGEPSLEPSAILSPDTKTTSPKQPSPAAANKKQGKTGKKAGAPSLPTKSGNVKKTAKPSTKEQPHKKTIEDFITVGAPVTGQAHQWSVNLVKSAPTSQRERLDAETFSATAAESFAVYRKYQVAVHGDPEEKCTEDQYRSFLVDSPLQASRSTSSSKSTPDYGSYHCQHFLDGRLFMVGVIDILPGCLSSVYLYYDPEFTFLTPGTLAALYEIAFTRKLARSVPDLTQYYLGYYAHGCPKMRYKGNFMPSFLLCPETYRWQPIEKCTGKLDQSKYSRLDEDPHYQVDDVKTYLQTTLILFQQQALPYELLMGLSIEKLNSKITEYAALAGQVVVSSMLLYLDESDVLLS